jgi:REP element-mobilizing transposase RayT
MSIYRIFIHAVFCTKNRKNIITQKVEEKLFPCLFREFNETGCKLLIVNGLEDHIHCLFILHAQKSISETIKHIKGVSSHYVNQSDIIPEKFSWQKGYAAFSVSESHVDRVYNYINNQKRKRKTLEEEGTKFTES